MKRGLEKRERNNCQTAGDNKGLIAHRAATGRIFLYAVFRMRQDSFPEMGIDVNGACRDAVASQFGGWAPELIDLVKVRSKLHAPIYSSSL